jgi:hypothetical protein
VLLDVGRVHAGSRDYPWLIAEGLVVGAALVVAWRNQERIGLAGLLVLAACFQAAMVGAHLASGVSGDHDTTLYAEQGHALLHGDYPHSEYPTGAVLLFAIETALGGGNAARTANALAMIPFQLLVVASIWLLRTRWSAWLAALAALWPLDVYFWEFRFDLAAAALLVFGAVLALRKRFVLAGLVLGIGAAAKWTPALALLALVLWLAASRRPRPAIEAAGAAAAAFAVLTVPFLAWSAHDVLAAYSTQGGRTIIGESLPYLPLHWLGLAHLRDDLTHAADVPGWANGLASAVQLVLVAGTILLAIRARSRPPSAIAIAVLVPVVFLLTNRIFSPQYLVVLVPAWAVAIALLARTRREQLVFGGLAAAASAANLFVYPYALPFASVTWQVCSTLVFVFSLALTGRLLAVAAGWRYAGKKPSKSISAAFARPRYASRS